MSDLVVRARGVAALSVAVVLLAGACGDDGGDTGATTAEPERRPEEIDETSSTTSARSATSPPSTTTSESEASGAHTISIEVVDGEVVGGVHREQIERGTLVRIEVVSDSDDLLHVHGYDLTAEVEAGAAGGLDLTADIPGVFEVELEESHVKLAELEIR